MLALLLAAALVQAPAELPSNKCLTELAAAGGDELDIRDHQMRQAALIKFDAVMRDLMPMMEMLEEYDAHQTVCGAKVAESVSEGSLTPDAAEALLERVRKQRVEMIAIFASIQEMAPSCPWPPIPPAPDI